LLLLAHADIRFTSAVKTEQPEVVPYYIGLLTTAVSFVFVYIDKEGDHVTMLELYYAYVLRQSCTAILTNQATHCLVWITQTT